MSVETTIREYNPSSGALMGTVSTLSFGKVSAGAHSRVRVFDIAFGSANTVSNLSIGLISNADIVVNPNPGTIYSDGSSQNGHFGIMSSQSFDPTISSQTLTRHYTGLNTTGTAADVNNVLVGMKSSTTSYYIYLDVEVASEATTAGNGAYKLFFDYS